MKKKERNKEIWGFSIFGPLIGGERGWRRSWFGDFGFYLSIHPSPIQGKENECLLLERDSRERDL